jgi:hypothetical protein
MTACSINEVEGLARRAARGAGLTWGLAEEAAKATRWLAARRLPCVPLLTRHLQANDGVAYDAVVPQAVDSRWSARSGLLCPIVTGAALSDIAQEIAAGARITLDAVAYPLLLSAFLGRAAKATGQGFELRWPGVTILCLPGGPCIEARDQNALETDRATDVTISATAGEGQPIERRPESLDVAAADWTLLKGLAARTYVPATVESRLLGAGAGLNDND